MCVKQSLYACLQGGVYIIGDEASLALARDARMGMSGHTRLKDGARTLAHIDEGVV